jgi:hypothetical protein
MEVTLNAKKLQIRNEVLNNLSKLINLSPNDENLFDIYKELEWLFSEDKIELVKTDKKEENQNNLLFIP